MVVQKCHKPGGQGVHLDQSGKEQQVGFDFGQSEKSCRSRQTLRSKRAGRRPSCQFLDKGVQVRSRARRNRCRSTADQKPCGQPAKLVTQWAITDFCAIGRNGLERSGVRACRPSWRTSAAKKPGKPARGVRLGQAQRLKERRARESLDPPDWLAQIVKTCTASVLIYYKHPLDLAIDKHRHDGVGVVTDQRVCRANFDNHDLRQTLQCLVQNALKHLRKTGNRKCNSSGGHAAASWASLGPV
ncbi:MAG: hypothetical protein WBP18_07835 [Paracoccaceae bacterium]